MGKPGHRSDPGFPHAPLELLHPLTIPGAEIGGIKAMEEVPGPDGIRVWRLLRMVLLWTVGHSALWDTAKLEEFERDLLSHPDAALGQPCGLLTGFMARGPCSDRPREAAWACLCVAEWASAKGFRFTAAEFAQAAALAWEANPRYACLAAELLWVSGQSNRAEHWFHRTRRLAVWRDDRICEVRALSRLAEVARARCRREEADDLRSRAVRVAERHDVDLLGDDG